MCIAYYEPMCYLNSHFNEVVIFNELFIFYYAFVCLCVGMCGHLWRVETSQVSGAIVKVGYELPYVSDGK